MIATLAQHVVADNSNVYDLGCSLGAVSLAVSRQIKQRNITIHAVDNSPPMINKLEKILAAQTIDNATICCHLADIDKIAIHNASLVVLNFTLQFLPTARRDAIMCKIYRGLNANGVLVLSEKVNFGQTKIDSLIDKVHHDFKKSMGYSKMEIAAKRNALENVLISESIGEHQQRIKNAGFAQGEVWFQCLNFASIIAVKQPR